MNQSNNREVSDCVDGKCGNPHCTMCNCNHGFQMPTQLIEALIAGKLVVFAGAGISTESQLARAGRYRFYDRIHESLKLSATTRPAFPELMSAYSLKNGRARLLQEVKQHLEYGDLFHEIRSAETRFHRELATIPFLNEIYTTNWDDYFETECYATPFVTADDFAFWHLPGRKVFKLHGSINNIGSLVITKADYDRCYRSLRDGLIGSTLKLALATKTILFVGYSLKDPDFVRLQKLVHKELGNSVPAAYWVTIGPEWKAKQSNSWLRVIQTDATYFVTQLKSILVKRNVMIPDSRWAHSIALGAKIRREHSLLVNKYRLDKHPEMLLSAFYQDGVSHACGAILTMAFSGRASHECHLRQTISGYDRMRGERLKERRYGDVAYIEGYINGLIYPLMDKSARENFPHYFLFGRTGDIKSFAQYCRIRAHARDLHQASYNWARRAASSYEYEPGSLVIHHRPFL